MPPAKHSLRSIVRAAVLLSKSSEHYKGVRYQRRQLPRRLASVAYALLLWTVLAWWVSGGGRYIAELSFESRFPWLPSLVCAVAVPFLWRRGNSIIDRALRTLPRLLYSLQVDHWKLLIVDVVSKPLARFTTVAQTVLVLNLALQLAPQDAQLTLPRLFHADDDKPQGTFKVNAAAVADVVCPISRRALRALATSIAALTALALRKPPTMGGSHSFRVVPLHLRGNPREGLQRCLSSPLTLGPDMAPNLVLFSKGKEVVMPEPTANGGPLEWTFDHPLTIDEYTLMTAKEAPPELDPVEWRLEGRLLDGHDQRWHGIHETDMSMENDVPLLRESVVKRRFIAPHGEVPKHERGWLGKYYRALQQPHEDRDRCAMALLLQGLIVPPLLLLGTLPWLPVFGIELSSVAGLTSMGGVAVGAALSLAKSEVLENLFAGTLLSAQGQLINGDEVDIRYQVGNSQQSLRGRVLRIGSAYVSIADEAHQVVQIPNRRVLGSIICIRPSAASSATRSANDVGLSYLSRSV